MKKLTAIFITLLAFTFTHALPVQISQTIGNNTLLIKLESNTKVSNTTLEEMPKKKKSSRSGKKNRKVRK
tara:strand:+ start:682 stop:891 length:210 start_codon:yes stop_codon:yes gene_type:complete